MAQGIIYVKVALYLECDAETNEVQEIVNEMDYEFTHPMISHTEIKEIEDNELPTEHFVRSDIYIG